jgi:hypothetical protein
MKPSRLARRYNKKGRQQKKVLVIEQHPSANVFSLSIISPVRTRACFQVLIEGATTTADNTSILPSKKRLTHVVKQSSIVTKKKLSKKERKRLEKVLDVKRKKAQVRTKKSRFDQ